MKFRVFSLDLRENCCVPVQPGFRIVGRDNVYLFDPACRNIINDIHDLLMFERIRFRVFAAGRVGTEFTDIFTDIGRIDMAVDIEVSLFTMHLHPSLIRQCTQLKKVHLI